MEPQKYTGLVKATLTNWYIVIVDDTPDNLMVARTALQFHGAKVYTATNGIDGMELLKVVIPTVILMDIRMPRMNGWEMLKAVRSTPEIADTPVIAITAYAMDSDRETMLAAGFDGYISKPFDLFTIASTIELFVKQKQSKSGDASTL